MVLNAGLGVCDAVVEGKGGSFMSVMVHSVHDHSVPRIATRCGLFGCDCRPWPTLPPPAWLSMTQAVGMSQMACIKCECERGHDVKDGLVAVKHRALPPCVSRARRGLSQHGLRWAQGRLRMRHRTAQGTRLPEPVGGRVNAP